MTERSTWTGAATETTARCGLAGRGRLVAARCALRRHRGSAPGAASRRLSTITVDTLPIANGLPLDLGIKKGFFAAQGIEIKKRTLQSGNDIVLALANNNGEIGYIGWVPDVSPARRASRSRRSRRARSRAPRRRQLAEHHGQGRRARSGRPPDLAGKTIAVNALKGVGEVMIKAALKKVGVDPNSVKLLAVPFPTMRTALQNGQVDASGARSRSCPRR